MTLVHREAAWVQQEYSGGSNCEESGVNGTFGWGSFPYSL